MIVFAISPLSNLRLFLNDNRYFVTRKLAVT